MKKYFLILALLSTLTACDQAQAPISDLGKQIYARGGSSHSYEETSNEDEPNGTSYKADMSAPEQAEPARTPVVGVSDLPPPSQGAVLHNIHEPSAPNAPANLAQEKPSVIAESPDTVSSKDGISLIWPVTGGKVVGHFKGASNDGINIAMSNGEPIAAAASGTVVYSGNDLQDYGNMVIVRHDNNWMTAYANASRIVAKKGNYVKQGDIIAYVGSSGNVKSPQLHFALRKGKTPVDPEQYLPKN